MPGSLPHAGVGCSVSPIASDRSAICSRAFMATGLRVALRRPPHSLCSGRSSASGSPRRAAPRLVLALARAGQLPALAGRLAPRLRTPDFAILTTGAVAIALALGGDFVRTLAASSASRLLIFVGCAAAQLRLRREAGAPGARFRLPLGAAVATFVLVACGALLAAASAELARVAVLMLVGGLLWLISNGKRLFRRTR